MTHQASELVYAGQRLFLSSVETALSIGKSFITHLTVESTPNPIMTETIVHYVPKEIDVDREELIDRVNEATAGSRHDYLTRGDVTQIVDATIQVMSGAVDAGQTSEELEDVPQAPQAGDEQVQGGEDSQQSQPQAPQG